MIPFIPTKRTIIKNKVYKIAYFGSSSHQLELSWLRELFIRLQNHRNDILIDVIVSNKWRRKLRDIPRLKMIYPMNWECFLLDSYLNSVDIVLVPLLNSSFNYSRSAIKFFDVVRLNAVGIYSNRLPYSEFISNNVDGVLLNDNHTDWINTIDYLLSNHELMDKLRDGSTNKAKQFLEQEH